MFKPGELLQIMNRTDIAYLINSTPKYYYLLPLHLLLVRRYAPELNWSIYIASEEPDHPILQECVNKYGAKILLLKQDDRFFLESRLAATLALPPEIKYVFPIQEDFLLERKPDVDAIKEAFMLMSSLDEVASIRFMPCPGPVTTQQVGWASLKGGRFMFSYQATLWRRGDYVLFMSAVLDMGGFDSLCPPNLSDDKRKKWLQVDFNIAENQHGQRKFEEVLGHKTHLGWVRQGKQANAVYLSPWPYRPTAVEKGVLGQWAIDLAKREGYPLTP
jgi:hypothetical protein